MRRVAALSAAAAGLLWAGPGAAQDVPPDQAWRSIETEHFRVTFPAPLEALARRAGGVAERARARLAEVLVDAPGGRVEVVLTDHADVSNGSAGIAPYPRVVVFARPPVDGFALSQFDDWIDLVVTHELAHIHHLDVTGVPGRVLRALFGRVPASWPFFPSQAAPGWVVEGLATWYESSLTGQGRVEGTYLAMMLRTAALEGRFESVDQASGRSPTWPSGQRAYAYGALAFEWLLERYGPERMRAFVDAVGSQWVPYRLDAAAREAFGVTFSEAWRLWQAELESEARAFAATVAARPPTPPIEPLTEGARLATHGQVGPGGLLAYARNDGLGDSHLRFRPLDGGADGAERTVRTNGSASFTWAPDGSVIAAQIEVVDRSRLFKDLYRITPDGRTERLTHDTRLEHPSLLPGGRTAIAVQNFEGRAALVRVRLADGTVEPLAELPAEGHWGFPAVSPDGSRTAAIWWQPERGPDLVLLDTRTGALLTRVTDDAALDLAPAWAPDGTLIWVSDRTGVPNLYAAVPAQDGTDVGTHRQITDVATGVAFPSVDPSARWIVLSYYRATGWELARLPYDPESWVDPLPAEPEREGVHVAATRREPPVRPAEGPVQPYQAWHTLRPRHWKPRVLSSVQSRGRRVLGPFLGLSTESRDVVGRHRVEVAAGFSTTEALFDGGVGYEYRGFGSPILSVTARQDWDATGPLRVERDGDGATGVDTLYLRERERRVGADLTFQRNRYRRAWALGVGGGLAWERRTLLGADLDPTDAYTLARPNARLGDLRLSLSTSSAREYEVSVGPGAGWTASARVRRRHEFTAPDSARGQPGQDRAFDEALGWLRMYRSFDGPGFARHVLALQVAGGSARGPGADAFHFEVGGASGRSETVSGLGLFGGSPLLFPVRGYPRGWQSGRHAWAATLEWRVPLAVLNRGWRLVPVHLDRLHGALFVDAGNAWGPQLGIPLYDRPREATLVGAGAELRLEMLTFFTVPLSLRAGVGAPLVGGDGVQAYLRVGSAF